MTELMPVRTPEHPDPRRWCSCGVECPDAMALARHIYPFEKR